jgi:hypothetical protein
MNENFSQTSTHAAAGFFLYFFRQVSLVSGLVNPDIYETVKSKQLEVCMAISRFITSN